MEWTRERLADAIHTRIAAERHRLIDDFATAPIHHCVIDNLLPPAAALAIRRAFPPTSGMSLRKSLRETKFVTAQMDSHNPLLKEAIFAFQDARIVDLIAQITGIRAPEPDRQLYAGGLSLMTHAHFLSPHVDNSHDRDRKRYRVLNLLYYVSPGWQEGNGGSLELWPQGVKRAPVVIPSQFNRLVIMHTHRSSWHSVNAIRTTDPRCCVSNYYFSPFPPEGDKDYFHVTSFRGRPEQPLRDLALRADGLLRGIVRKLKPSGLVQTQHYYRRGE